MTIAYLQEQYLPLEEARISPMDRGFLFGDGIYEVIPSHGGRMVGFGPHMDRLRAGLAALEIHLDWTTERWREVCERLIQENGGGSLGIYLHVSRGTDSRRFHAYPKNIPPTVFAYAFDIPPAPVPDRDTAAGFSVTTAEDLRWKRCNIKSTALLGNVMHFNQGYHGGNNETILYNERGEVTEAAACNVFVVKDGTIATPPSDYQILPGITRLLLLEILRADGSLPVEERVVTLAELGAADEVWLTSSTKEIAPVVMIDGAPVGDGAVGPVWEQALSLFAEYKFDY
ncbi:MAG: D-amino acid aminotransferase [Halieaceae bacterium]|jgi:D-alanine transaminase|nr:D-amino acid aminotransferase [Halieaceae bacterium]